MDGREKAKFPDFPLPLFFFRFSPVFPCNCLCMTDAIKYITENWGTILTVVTSVIAAASAIAAVTPTPKDDGIVKAVMKVVNWLAINVGNAKNKA